MHIRIDGPIYCDRVETDESLNIVNIVFALNPQSLPYAGTMTMVYFIEFGAEEQGESFRTRVVVQTPDMKACGGSAEEGESVVVGNPFGGPSQVLIFHEVILSVESYGLYPVILVLNDRPVVSRALGVFR